MKNKLIITASIIGLLIAIMGVIPIIFEGKIIQKIKDTVNNSVNAKVDFNEVQLSLFKSFPKLSISIRNFSITGINEFNNIRLLNVETLSTSVNLSSLWKNDGLKISSILLKKPTVNLLVNEEGKSNWDIAKIDSISKKPDRKESSSEIDLEKIEVRHASFSLNNQASPMSMILKNGSFDLSGAMKGSNSKLDISGQADSIAFEYGGSRYVSNLNLDIKGTLRSDFDKMAFTILDNKLLINKLPLEANGTFSMGEKDYNFDLMFKSPASSFADLLGFIPAQYQSHLKGVETKGEILFNGFLKGIYSDTIYPGFGLDLKIAGGRLKYPNLPKEVENIELVATISKLQGNSDLLKIDIEKFGASIAGNPVQATLHVATPVSDPALKGNLKGIIDFATLKQALPMDSIDLMGIIDATVDFGGNYSSIEKGKYEDFKTDGTVTLKDFEFTSAGMPQKMQIKAAALKLNPKSITLNNMTATMGESDFNLDGTLTNYWGYFLKKGILEGNINLNSNYININQLIPKPTLKDTSTVTGKPFEIPENINITIQSSVIKALYEKMTVSGITGKVVVKDKKIILDGLNMNMLSGKLVVSGSYATPKEQKPIFDFKMDIKDFDLPTAYQSLSTVRQYLPVTKESTGAFNTGLSLSGNLNDDYSPQFQTVNGGGVLSAKNVELVGAGLFNEIGRYFKKDLFKQVKVNDFAANFKLVDGGLEIAPFSTKVAGQDVTIGGRQSVSKVLDYRIDFKVNRTDLSEEVTQYIGMVPGAENIAKYPIGINLAGPIDKPDVKVDLTEAKKLVETEFKKKAGSAIQDAVKKFGLDKLFK